jgi:pimeloyl-ACP methyl ester carboxylesterase
MTGFVLVHGAWHGAWCWRRVLPVLWAAGHRAFAVSLTGVGERAHLLSERVTLQTHVSDVINTIEAEELRDTVLVGHSYGGMVITGVADRLSDRLARLVYVDAVVPHSGESWSSGHTPQTQATRRDMIAAGGSILPPDPRIFGLAGSDHAWVARRQTAHPGGVYDAPLHFDSHRFATIRRTFIDCTSPALPTIALARQRVRAEPGWTVLEIATGHDIMISAPQPLVAALLASCTG